MTLPTAPLPQTASMPDEVTLIEVGLRDGLQSETAVLPTADKVRMAQALLRAGVRRLQIASFVNPARVPQMADAEALCAALVPDAATSGAELSGLALNTKGLQRLQAAGLRCADLGMSASEAHSQRNTGAAVAQKSAEILAMIAQGRALGLKVRAAVQCAFGYARHDDVPAALVCELAQAFAEAGADEIALADSSGHASPAQVQAMLDAVLPLTQGRPLVLHLHDTRGMGLANVLAALERGIRHFDTAFGGLGGCPFIPGAAGNIATEDTIYMLERLGIRTGISLAGVAAVSAYLAETLGRPLPGKLYTLAQETTE